MGQNRAFDRPFMVMDGSVRKTGGSNLLTKGQLALVNTKITTPQGIAIVSTTAGAPKDEKIFELRAGIKAIDTNRSRNNFSESTKPFSLEEVNGLKVSAPQITEATYDELIVGYDGFDPATSFKFKPEDAYFRLSLKVDGGILEYSGGQTGYEMVNVNIQVPGADPFNNCDIIDECAPIDCREVVTEMIETLRRRQLVGGMLLEEVVDITPVYSCKDEAGTVDYQFYTLNVCDTGTDGAEALVGAQYDFEVRRTDRVGANSTYQVFLPVSEGAPADFGQTLASLIKDCGDCPTGYNPAVGGYLYAFTIEDDGADLSSTFSGLANYVTGSVVKSGNNNGVGYYTVILSTPMTEVQKTALIARAAPSNTITISLIGPVADMCENATVTDTAWVAGEICTATEHTYSIVLPDNKCGEDRLEELQGAFPTMAIAIADSTDSAVTATLAGTAGSIIADVDGTVYTTAFATSLANTATAFVAAHAANILADSGVTVTAVGGTLIFNGDAIINAGISNTGTVTWTTATVILEARRACQTKYQGTVITNIVCDECDDVFLDYYKSEMPEEYDNKVWTKVTEDTTNPGCLCGIRFKAKPFVLVAEEALVDQVGFTETSSQLTVAAGFPEEIREGIGILPKSTAKVTWLQTQRHRTHLGGNLRDLENEGRSYFRDLNYQHNYLGRILTGTTSNIENQQAQYVQYTLQVRHKGLTQGFAAENVENINYDVFVELGKHKDVENLLNNIAANAGKKTVKATA